MTDTALSLYNEVIQIDRCCMEQRKIFSWWMNHNSNPITEVLSWDTETNGLSFGLPYPLYVDDTNIETTGDIFPFGFSMCIPYKDTLAVLWARHTNVDLYAECIKLLKVPGEKVGHNIRYDLRVCKVNGIEVAGENNCTLTMARIHWNRRRTFDLKELTNIVAPELAGYEDELKAVHRNIKSSYTRAGNPKNFANYSFIPDEIISKYAKLDAYITWLLNYQLRPDIDKIHKEIYHRERKIISVINELEYNGMYYDYKQSDIESKLILKKIPKVKSDLYKLAKGKFNPNSSKQLLTVLVDKLKVPVKHLTCIKKKKSKVTTGKEQLQICCVKLFENKALRSFVDSLLILRALNKINNTYLIPLSRKAKYNNGYIYFNLNPTDTVTGRMTSNDPSLHTMPKEVDKDDKTKINPVRRCFITVPGQHNIFLDYSQMEMWLFAILAKEKTMLKALLAGCDIHATVAYQIYGQDAINEEDGEEKDVWLNGKIYTLKIDKLKRFKCKAVNFGIIYGMGFKQLAIQIKSNEIEAFDLKKQYLSTYPRIEEHNKEIAFNLRRFGYIEDIFGKRYNIEISNAYKGINAEVQGACAQIMKIALIGIFNYFRSFGKYNPLLRLVVHDEIVFSVFNEYRALWPVIIYNVEKLMTRIPQLLDLGIVLKVDGKITNTSWSDKHEYYPWINKKIKYVENTYNGLLTKSAEVFCDV